MKKDKYNVVQWSSGNVGKASIKGIVDNGLIPIDLLDVMMLNLKNI